MSGNIGVHVEDIIQKFLDGELSPDEVEAVGAHLERCGRCRKALADLKAVYGALEGDCEPAPLRPMWPVVRKVFEPRSLPRFDFSFGLATSAAAAVGVVLGVLLGTFREPPQYLSGNGGTYSVGSYLGDDSVPTLDEVYIDSFGEDGEEQ